MLLRSNSECARAAVKALPARLTGEFLNLKCVFVFRKDHSYYIRKYLICIFPKMVEVSVKHPENYFCKMMVLFRNVIFPCSK